MMPIFNSLTAPQAAVVSTAMICATALFIFLLLPSRK